MQNIRLRFTIMQFLLWFTFGTFGIFYVAYLRDFGYSSKFIALGLTISTLAGIGAQYLWGYISDLTSKIREIFMVLLIALMAVVVLFMVFVSNGPMVIVMMVLFGVTWMPMEALLDSWILSTDDLPHSNYGSIRSGGSFGFAIITVIFGSMIVRYGFRISPIAFAISGTLLLVLAFMTKTHTSKKPNPMGLDQVKELLSNGRYLSILIFSILIFVGHMSINNFYIYVVSGVGGDESLIGSAASAAAFCEIFGFYIGGKLQKKVNPLLLMVFVAVMSFARVFFLAYAVSSTGVLITAAVQGIAFSIFLGTFKVYISEITPLKLLASAQTLAASTYFGISSIIGNILGGILIEDYGMKAFYDANIIIAGVAIVYIIIVYLITIKKYGNHIHTHKKSC